VLRRFRSGRALAVPFAAVAVAFTIGIAAEQTFSFRIRAAAHEITGNSAPSISYLSSMRVHLRELEARSDDLVNDCRLGRCDPMPPRLEELRRLAREDWQTYRELPAFPWEPERWPEVEAALALHEEVLARTLDEVAQRRPERALEELRTAVRPASERLDGLVAQLIAYDHQEGVAVASRIDALARVSTVVSGLLVLIGAGLTGLAAAIGIRAVRQHEQSLRGHAEELDQFAGRVAHDIQSPLGATAAALHVARRHTSEEGRRSIERAERGVNRVSRLVDGLLEFARAGAGGARGPPADVAEVIDGVIGDLRPAAEGSRVELRVEPAPHERLACSPGVLTSILSNLVRNAIAHMSDREVREVRIAVGPGTSLGAVRIEVEDTGPGIPDELGETVFEAFVRGPDATEPGSGLGLATVKRLVLAHGGRISLRSRVGVGSVFAVELPRAPAPDLAGGGEAAPAR
jgi:signal transduction histidine kinase